MCNNYVRDELLNGSVVYILFDLIPTLPWSSEVGLLVLINPLYSEPYMGFDYEFQWDIIEMFLSAVAINIYVIKG